MLFDSLKYRTMESSLQAMALKQNLISQNIANYETPDYKAKKVSFQDLLEDARRDGETEGKYHFMATVYQDDTTMVRPDGNNVDLEKENMDLLQTYYQTVALYQKIGGEFSNMRYVLTQANFK